MTDDRDPFATADSEPTDEGTLVERDPDAPADESGEYRITGAASFDDVLRSARRQGFLAGAAVGGVAGAAIVGLLALAIATAGPQGGYVAVAPAAPAQEEAPVGAPVAEAPGRVAAPAASRPIPRAGGRAASREELAPLDLAAPPAGHEGATSAKEPAAEEKPGSGAGAGGGADTGAGAGADTGARGGTGADTSAAAPAAARPPVEKDVIAALGARRDELDACVAETPGDASAVRGRRFRILVVVEPSGRVSEARAYDDEIASSPLGTCLVRLARETTFPPFEGEPVRIEVRVHAEDAQ